MKGHGVNVHSIYRRTYLAVSIVGALSFIGCARLSGFNSANTAINGNNLKPVDLQTRSLQILAENCTSCHKTTAGPKGVKNLLDVPNLLASGYVIPGDPKGSPIFSEVDDNSMPQSGPLSDADKHVLHDWILGLGDSSGSPIDPLPPQGDPSTPTPTPTPTPPSTPTPTPIPIPGSTTPSPTPTPTPTPVVPDPAPVPSAPSFQQVSSQILTKYCVRCHNETKAKAGFAFDSYARTLKAVSPGAAANSIIFNETDQGSMPPGQPLSADQTKMIYDWIQAGAKNN